MELTPTFNIFTYYLMFIILDLSTLSFTIAAMGSKVSNMRIDKLIAVVTSSQPSSSVSYLVELMVAPIVTLFSSILHGYYTYICL